MKYLLLLCLLLTTACSFGPDAKRTKALESLKRLDAYTRSGVVRIKYKELLGEARYAVNAVVTDETIKDAPRGDKFLWIALSNYDTADSLWAEADFKTIGDGLQSFWQQARENTKKAEELMK